MSIFREEIDIWPYRAEHLEIMGGQQVWTYRNDVECNANRDGVIHQPGPYDPNLADHYVRIPALMFHRAPPVPNLPNMPNPSAHQVIQQSWLTRPMRTDAVTHVWINTTGQCLSLMDAYYRCDPQTQQQIAARVQPNYTLRLSNIADFSVVYPCFKPVVTGVSQMLFGVCFCRRQTGAQYTRSYLRYALEDTQSTGAFDITRDFFMEPNNPAVPNVKHYRSGTLFQRNPNWYFIGNSIAFYVCRGSRLYVGDERNATQQRPGHTRSLYQAGSLVVCTGTKHISFSCTVRDGPNNVNYGWNRITESDNPILLPLNRTRRQLDTWEQNRDLCTHLNSFNDHVMFLGVIESEFNSACWRLLICDADPNYCRITLNLPNNGVIEDIAPWHTGFELVRARQRYEQSWRAVIGCPANAPVPQFEVPGDQYVFRRILGLHDGNPNNWGPMTINFPYNALQIPPQLIPQFGPQNNIRRYMINILRLAHFERLTGWHQSAWRNDIPPPAPPLYPPIKMAPHRYKYVDKLKMVRFSGYYHGQAVFAVDGIEGAKFHLKTIENQRGYKWVPWTKESSEQVIKYNQEKGNPNFDWLEWSKWSEDPMMYLKLPDQTNYKTKMWYLNPT